ncbi:LysE family transporter [Trinickia caryophylli]|uniref:LysE/ArgO family amino acid transporter n=1 Tax=Trinickia caryophylli TaxID=28094 RepID=UPI000C87E9F4|nr:LysE family transporter [Trinickia caryophylli]PMS08596.1 lysine transporter LysE [Trinickia caryophylli]TRX18167.1 lysine transporter LysE [Trinickia caryophylli]TRX18801.1 lysine transporter LysE [Trinickia caryophylli]WQE10401.1 LysE family transporter [Trinickia caryophylli]WQE11046.1 LysE family transporter [Trinickia caryophylli]
MLDTSVFVEGLLLGLGLFSSVGPKDVFVIRHSISGQHLLLVVAVCAGSDALLIALGAGGFTALLTSHPIVVSISLWGGVAYLICHGALAFRAAIGTERTVHAGDVSTSFSFKKTLLATAVVSLLNPYAWIDTVFVLGAMTASKSPGARWPFVLGAIIASSAWFLFLSRLSYACRWIFCRSIAWRTLDGFVAVTMFGIAAHLVTTNL